MKVLDLFCGAGGASMGLQRAGFEVVGVDINFQPNYPFEFYKDDALDFDLDGYDAYWASPPCQGYTWATKRHRDNGKEYEYLIEPIRDRFLKTNKPYVIENVPGSPIRHNLMLEGHMFGLGVIRRRYFETNFRVSQPKWRRRCGTVKEGDYVTVAGYGSDGSGDFDLWKEAMQIDWMTREELKQAVPPAYSQYIGEILYCQIRENYIVKGII